MSILAKTRMFSFTVTGTGLFPLDMLRYDQCWPRTSNDAELIERINSQYNQYSAATREVQEIELSGANNHGEPTEDRWKSFGWKVRVRE